MKKTIFCLWMLACAALCLAQDSKSKPAQSKPDLTGTWALDKSKSDLGRFGRGAMASADMTLTISHTEPELKITRKLSLNGQERSEELSYYSDGRGESNHAFMSNGDLKTKTKWDGNKLVSKASTSYTPPRGGDTIFVDTTEKRELAVDGKTLTITVSISGPRGLEIIKQVFNRAP